VQLVAPAGEKPYNRPPCNQIQAVCFAGRSNFVTNKVYCSSVTADRPRDALSVEILSTAAQLYEQVDGRVCLQRRLFDRPVCGDQTRDPQV